MTRIPVGIVGITGYTGLELSRLLGVHNGFELARACSRSAAGQTMAEVFPALAGTPLAGVGITEPDPADLAAACQLVFLAVPHGTAMQMAGQLVDLGTKVVDLSADFRLRDPAAYEQWYGLPHVRTDLLAEAAFGLPEHYQAEIVATRITANPGCYPTSAILGLAPALRHGIIETDGLVIDSKSGVTGAGRKAVVSSLFCEVQDSFKAYNLGKHRHTPEIEQELSRAAGQPLAVSFNPHLVPMNRGILSTMYARLTKNMSTEDVLGLYQEEYQGKPWIRVLKAGRLPETRHVRGTMFCDLGLVVDPRTRRLIVVAAIDNLCRGASGQALANANLMTGLAVQTGLEGLALVP